MATLKNTTIDSTESIRLPVGNTSQRPGSPQLGMMRYNTDEEGIEIYNGDDWVPLADAGGAGLYDFTTATFTPGGKAGHDGPSLTQARNGITGGDAFKNNTSFFNTSGGIMSWTVPKEGTYRIEAWGAQGGDDGNAGRGGRGARMRGDFNLTEGETIRIIVGQRADMSRNGAGGGSFVFRNATDSQPLIAAGGGGGAGGSQSNQTTGGQTGTSGGQSYGGSYASGSGGQGGSTSTNSGWGGAGSGWLSNGQSGGSYGGQSYAPRNGGNGGNQFVCSGGYAGFGGGGGGGCNGGGGGGGYSGGGCGGGGGGSYNGGSNQSNTGSTRQNDGQVTISLIS
jgi:hypothetical protein